MTSNLYQNHPELKKERFIFATQGIEELYLERYTPVDLRQQQPCKPVFIFLYPDTLTSDTETYPLYAELTKNGYSLVVLPYQWSKLSIESVKKDNDAIQLYLNSMNQKEGSYYAATRYILDHAQQWNIDPEQVIIGGTTHTSTTWLRLMISSTG